MSTERIYARPGFTLLELLLVLGIIGIIAAIVIIAINPAKQLEDARNAGRKTAVRETENALVQYIIDVWKEPPGNIPGSEPTARPICRPNVTDASCINLDVLTPVYLPALPVDSANTGAVLTGYRLYRGSASRLLVCSDYLPIVEPWHCSAGTSSSGQSSSSSALSSSGSSSSASTGSGPSGPAPPG